MNKPRSKDPRVLTCENVALYRLHYVPPYMYFRSISLGLHTVLRNSRQTFYSRFRVERILPLLCWTLLFNMKIAIVNILCLQYFDTTSKFLVLTIYETRLFLIQFFDICQLKVGSSFKLNTKSVQILVGISWINDGKGL